MDLIFEGQFLTGDDGYDFGITDLALVSDVDGSPILVTASYASGGVTAWNIADLTDPELVSKRSADTDVSSGVGAGLIEVSQPIGTGVLVTGLIEDGVVATETNGHDGVRPLSDAQALGGDWSHGVELNPGIIALADQGGDGFSLFAKTGDVMTLVDMVSDTALTHADQISAIAAVDDILLVASAAEYGITSYTSTLTGVSAQSSFGQQDGLGIMTPTALCTVQFDGQAFAVLASASGAAGALSVFQVGTDASLMPKDHVMDTLNSRFGAVQAVAVEPFGDGALVVAGGGDDGLSVMAMMPGGRLVHLASFADTLDLALSGVTSLALQIDGDTVQIFATSQGDGGVSHMSIDLSAMGLWTEASGGMLTGTNADDILMTSDSADTLDGGAGADIIVVTEGGDGTDTIQNFDVSVDRLNLSDWSFLYSASSLDIQPTVGGATISHRGNVITVTSADGQPLSPEQLHGAIDIDVMRLPTIAQDIASGDDGDNILRGTWGLDELSGKGGNDDLTGDAGDDTLEGGTGQDILYGGAGLDLMFGGDEGDNLFGGLGNDRIFGGDGTDTAHLLGDSAAAQVISFDAATNTVVLQTIEGTGTFTDVEYFAFDDVTVSFASFGPAPTILEGTQGADTLTGDAETATIFGYGGADDITAAFKDDDIYGGSGADSIDGRKGDDSLFGGAGNDTLFGSRGNDTLDAGSGDDVIYGGNDVDTFVIASLFEMVFVLDWTADSVTFQSAQGLDVITEVEVFVFTDVTLTFTNLTEATDLPIIEGTASDDVLGEVAFGAEMLGYDGNDEVSSGQGNDVVYGGAGSDNIWGGAGNDDLFGGSGADAQRGGSGQDLLYGGGGDDQLFGQSGSDLLYGGTQSDQLVGGDGDDLLFGGGGADDLRGGGKNDQLWGGAGQDTLLGAGDDDTLDGGAGHDILDGGAGQDTLIGGAGDDTLTGGTDDDVFLFSVEFGSDHITDYNVARDTTVLTADLFEQDLFAEQVVGLFGHDTEEGFALRFADGSEIIYDNLTMTEDFIATISIVSDT